MKSIRLIPVVLFAVTALLLLKGVSLVTQGGYALTGTDAALAQTQVEAPLIGEPPEVTDLSEVEEAAARRAAESLFSRAGATPIETQQIDALPIFETKQGEKVAFGTTDGDELTERAVLERLGERRIELDNMDGELASREALIAAAEARLNERIAELEALEASIQQLVDQKNALADEQFASLVSVYENMRSDDAARVFNDMDMDVLLRLAISINPRKMSPILADMDSEKARNLTLLMAAEEVEAPVEAPAGEFDDLPQIVGE